MAQQAKVLNVLVTGLSFVHVFPHSLPRTSSLFSCPIQKRQKAEKYCRKSLKKQTNIKTNTVEEEAYMNSGK